VGADNTIGVYKTTKANLSSVDTASSAGPDQRHGFRFFRLFQHFLIFELGH
jgi:hypothetical protein